MRYKEFKKAVEDWGRKHNYATEVTMGDFGIHLKVEFDGEFWFISTISDVDRFVLNTDWSTFTNVKVHARVELFDILVELAKTPIKEREDKKDNLDSIIHRLEVIQTNAEDVMNWTIQEIQERSWSLRSSLEDIIIDLEEHQEANERGI